MPHALTHAIEIVTRSPTYKSSNAAHFWSTNVPRVADNVSVSALGLKPSASNELG
jgi:hypothetical protein